VGLIGKNKNRGKRAMNVKDVMTPGVLSVTPDESIFVAARLMLQKKISGLPVVDGHGKLVGIVSEGDFLRRTETGTKAPAAKMDGVFSRPRPACRRIRSDQRPQSSRRHD
jgi:CBS domain-containing protein